MTMEDNMDELHAKSLSDLQKQVPDEDFELIAKYVYARLAEHDPFMNALPEGEYYANAANGLRRFFVNEQGKIHNFKEEGTLKPFIDEYLGFSHYVGDIDFSYFYFVQFADLLNNFKTEIHSKAFKKDEEGRSTSELNEPYKQIFNELLYDIKYCIRLHENLFRENNFHYREDISFLFDILHDRERIKDYAENFKDVFSNIINLYKSNTNEDIQCFILYTIAFMGLYSIKEGFNNYWKNYRYPEIRRYYLLAGFSSEFHSLLKKEIPFYQEDENTNGNNMLDNKYHIVFLYLAKYILTTYKNMLKSHFKASSSRSRKSNRKEKEAEFDEKLNELTLPNLFLFYTLGGKATIRDDFYSINSDDKTFLIKKSKSFLDNKLYRIKLKTDNLETRNLYKNYISSITRKHNKYKKNSNPIRHLIYSFFARAIEYYSQSSYGENIPKWKLFAYLFNYLPSDFIHGRKFKFNGVEYSKKEFINNNIYNDIRCADDTMTISCYDEYFKLPTNARYYKHNFFKIFSEYNHVSITSNRTQETWEFDEKQYKEAITQSIEDYCDSILSQRQPETPNSSH